MSREARQRILDRVREATEKRDGVPHPGRLDREIEPPVAYVGLGRRDPVDAFEDRFRAAGGEVVRLPSPSEAREWLTDFAGGFECVSVGHGVTDQLHPKLPEAEAQDADLGVSVAVAAAAQTGSLVLSSRDGRRAQLLPPTHLVWISAPKVRGTLLEALNLCRQDLPAAVGLHSGPSKSADIGRVMLTGVHGPGRIIAAIREFEE